MPLFTRAKEKRGESAALFIGLPDRFKCLGLSIACDAARHAVKIAIIGSEVILSRRSAVASIELSARLIETIKLIGGGRNRLSCGGGAY
jgi:hypothetical protein